LIESAGILMNQKLSRNAEKTVGIHPAARLGAVSLQVSDLDRQIAFHQDILGFKLHWRKDYQAGMGAGGEDLLRFIENKSAVRPGRTTGLYHIAILVPNKRDLAQLLKRIAETRTPMQGMSDHGTHLALYLPDAEGNGIELAWDRAKEMWPDMASILKEGTPAAMRTLTAPLDVDDLMSELKQKPGDWSGMPPQTQVGHVHLHVSDLESTRAFYHGLLGFDITLESDRFGMIFFSAGGYHHHIGANIWNGAGAPPPPANAAGLQYFTVLLPDQLELMEVSNRVQQAGLPVEPVENGFLLRDPAQNGVTLTTKCFSC
jgi:catechol 2,3-dioxygenase